MGIKEKEIRQEVQYFLEDIRDRAFNGDYKSASILCTALRKFINECKKSKGVGKEHSHGNNNSTTKHGSK